MTDRKTLAVIPTYLQQPSDLEATLDALDSFRRTAGDTELLVIDDGSPTEGLVDEIEAASTRLDFEFLRKDENEGFSRTVNVGLRRALQEDKDAVLVNADIEFIEPGWLDLMRKQSRQDGAGPAWVVGALLLYPNGLIQHAGVYFSLLHRHFDHIYHYAPQNLPEAQHARRCPVTGALQFIRHEALVAVGVYDEEFRLGYEDVDYCIRVFLHGEECVYQPRVRAYHYESMFRGQPSPKVAEWQSLSWIYFGQKYREQSFAEWIPSII